MQLIHQRVDNGLLVFFHTQAQALHAQHAAKAIHNQRGQAIRFGVYQTAGTHIGKQPPVFHRAMNARADEISVDALIPEGHKSQRNLRLRIIEGAAQHTAARTFDRYHIARLPGARHPIDIAAEHPGIALQHTGFLARFQIRNGHLRASFAFMRAIIPRRGANGNNAIERTPAILLISRTDSLFHSGLQQIAPPPGSSIHDKPAHCYPPD